MAGQHRGQPAGSGSEPASQPEEAGETPASNGPAGSMQASAGRQPVPDAPAAAPPSVQPKRAAVPAGPFAQLLGPLHPVLRASPGAVLAAALLLHGAIASREPAGPGSGHTLAWPLTVSFLRALMTPASIQRLSTAARAYAAVAVAVAATLRRRQQQAQRPAQQVVLQQQPQQVVIQQQAPPPLPPQQQQQQQQQQQGPAPMQVESQVAQPVARPPQPPQQPHAPGATQGLVGAAKRKSSKPRSTQEALAAVGGPPRHAAAGAGTVGAAKGKRRRRRQPERLEVALDAGPSYEATHGRAPRRNGSAHRRSPSLADILLPPEPLPCWGQQRPRLDGSSAPQPTLASLGDAEQRALAAARQAGGPLAAENERLRRDLRSMQQQREGLESRVRQLQQLAMAAGGGRGRGGDAQERERLADAQALLGVEQRQLAAQRQAFDRERQEFRKIVESLAQTVLPPGAAAVVASAQQAMAAASSSPAPQQAGRQAQQAQRGQPAAAAGQPSRPMFIHMHPGPVLRPAGQPALGGLPLPARPVSRPQHGGQPPPPPPPSLPLALQGALQGLSARPPGSWQQAALRPPPLQQTMGVPSLVQLPGSFPPPTAGRPAFPGQLGAVTAFPAHPAPAPTPPVPAGPQPRPGGSSVAAAAQQLMDVLQRQQQQQLLLHPMPPQQQGGTSGRLQEVASHLLQSLMQRQQTPPQQAQAQAQAAPLQPQPGRQQAQAPQALDGRTLAMLQEALASGRLGPEQLRQVAGLLAMMKLDLPGGLSQLLQVQTAQQPQPQPAVAAPVPQPAAGGGGTSALLQYLNTAASQMASPAQQQQPQQQQPLQPQAPAAPAPAPQQPMQGASLPPALEAQLALLPPALREQMQKSLGRLCSDIQRGHINVRQLVATLSLPPEAQQRVAAMLQQMVQPPGASAGTAQRLAPTQQASPAAAAVAVPAAQQQQQQQPGLPPLGSSGATPEVSPNAAAGQSAFAAAAQRPLSASPVLQKVTADDVAPVHKQLPPIRTSSQTLVDPRRQKFLEAAAAAVGYKGAEAARQVARAMSQELAAQQLGQPQVPPAVQQTQPVAQQPKQAQQAQQPKQVQHAQHAQQEQLAGLKRKAPDSGAAAATEAVPNGGDAVQADGPIEPPAAKLHRTDDAGGAAAAGQSTADGGAGAAS